MIVMLALLNDGAILSIAYDNVHYKNKPESWNMRMVLGVSTVLGVIGVVSAFGLFYLGERVFHLDRAHIQTLMYLKLSVAGHLTIFLTRTRGPFWSIRPARILMIAVFGTQAVATLIAVYGLFMTPLGWGWAGLVWGYALLWFLVNDRIKLLAYRIFDPVKAEVEAKPTVEPKPEAKAKTTSDLTPQIATRAYELYEQQGRRDGQSVQNWDKAEREIQNNQAKAEPKLETKADPKPEVKAEDKPENKVASVK
jgi:H+-transporting ATPase